MEKPGIKYRLNNRGFTLIELMVTVVLIAVVLTVVHSMMSAGNRIFAQGDAKADVQSSLRVSGNFISDKLRYASDVEILDSLPADITAGVKEYIYEEGGKLKYYNGYTVSDVPGVLDGVQTGIHFEDKNSAAVLIRLNAALREQAYEVETAASLLNIGDSILISGSGPVIEFSPGMPVNANINARPIETIIIKTDPVGTTTARGDVGQVAFVADVTPADASQKTVRWEFTTPVSYATIESTSAVAGLLKFDGAAEGDIVNVRAVAMDGSGIVSLPYTITATEVPVVPGASVTVESTYDRIFQKNGEVQMTAKVEPESASHLAVTWSLNVGSSVATINDEGVLKTNALNSSNGVIVVTATLETGESDTKNIQIIKNITGIKIEEIKPPTTATKSKYIGKIRCLLLPDNIPATSANGVASIKWDMDEELQSGINGYTLTPNSDGTLSLNVNGQNKHAYFSIRATITPISGAGHTSNLVTIDFNN